MTQQVIDLARAKTVSFPAGALSFEMTSSEHTIARLTRDLSASWRAEEVSLTSSSVEFDRLQYRASRTCGFLKSISKELLEDSDNLEEVLNNSIASAAALAMDYAILSGDGVNQPLGILNQPGVATVTSVGDPSDWTKTDAAVYALQLNNCDVSNLAWVAHPRTFKDYSALADTTNQPLMKSPLTSLLTPYDTTALSITEGGGAESSAIAGDFSKVLVGIRSELRIELFDSGTVTDENSVSRNAVSDLMVHIRGYFRMDVGLTQPGHLCVMSGITTP